MPLCGPVHPPARSGILRPRPAHLPHPRHRLPRVREGGAVLEDMAGLAPSLNRWHHEAASPPSGWAGGLSLPIGTDSCKPQRSSFFAFSPFAPMTTAEHLTCALQVLPEPLKLELAREVARISEQAFRRGAQQAADHKLDPDLAKRVRFDVSYDEHPIYVGNFPPGVNPPVVNPTYHTSLERVAMEAGNADALGLSLLLDAAAALVRRA